MLHLVDTFILHGVSNFLAFVVKIIRCDTPCANGGNCTGLERCSCPKDYYGQHCDGNIICT